MSISTSSLKQILIISPEPWDGHFVSKHHYAVTLASRGNKVYFLDPPDPSLAEVQIKETKYDNLWSVSAPQVAKGLRFYPKVFRNFTERRWLEKFEDQIGQKFTTVWLFENSRFYDMGFAGNRLKIYHQVDLNQNFHVKEAASSADICFCTSDYILDEIRPYSSKAYKIHHGVNLFPEVDALSVEQKNNFLHTKINATYIGNLNMQYLDVALLAELVESFPNVQFQFVGGYQADTSLYKLCHKANNVLWWGKVDSELIPAILSSSDVVLVCYQEKYYVDQSSPHKIMEYLASGKVIAATYTDEYKDKQNLLEMVNSSKDYLKLFKKVVEDLEGYNSEEKQQARIAFAKDHSYEKQLEKIMKYLSQYNLKI